MCSMYRPSLGKGSEQLIVKFFTQSIPLYSVHKQLIGTFLRHTLYIYIKKENIIISPSSQDSLYLVFNLI